MNGLKFMFRPVPTMPVRMRLLNQWIDPAGRSFLACLKHGSVYGPVQAGSAAAKSGTLPCPTCCVEVADDADARLASLTVLAARVAACPTASAEGQALAARVLQFGGEP